MHLPLLVSIEYVAISLELQLVLLITVYYIVAVLFQLSYPDNVLQPVQ